MGNASETLALIISAQDKSTATLSKIENGINSMNGKVGNLNTSTSKFGSILTGIGVGIGMKVFDTLASGASKLAGLLPDLISKGDQFATTVRGIVEVTGMLPQQASVLATAANILGVSTDSVSTALTRLSVNATTNAKLFKEFGVQIAYTSTGAVDAYGTFQNLLNAMGNTGAGALSTATAIKLLGRGAADLLPLLEQGASGWQAFTQEAKSAGTYLDGPGLQAITNLDYTVNRFWNTISGAGTSILTQLAPLLGGFIDSITNFIQQNMTQIVTFVAQAANFIIGVIDGLFGLNIPMVTFASNLKQVGSAAGSAGDGLSNYNGAAGKTPGATKKAAAGTDAFTTSINKQVAAIDAQIAALEKSNSTANAQQQRNQILQSITDAKAQLAQIQNESIFAEGMTDTQKVLAEQKHAADLIAAAKAVSDAQTQLRQHDAQQANQDRIDQLNKEKQALQAKLAAHKAAAAKAGGSGTGKTKIPGIPQTVLDHGITLSNQALKNIQGLGDTINGPMTSAIADAKNFGLQFAASIKVFLGSVGSFIGGVWDFITSVGNFVSPIAQFFKPLTDMLGPAGTLAAFVVLWKFGGSIWGLLSGLTSAMLKFVFPGGGSSGAPGGGSPGASPGEPGGAYTPPIGAGVIMPKSYLDQGTAPLDQKIANARGAPYTDPLTGKTYYPQGGKAVGHGTFGPGTPGGPDGPPVPKSLFAANNTSTGPEAVANQYLQTIAQQVSPGGAFYQQMYNQVGAAQDGADASGQGADANQKTLAALQAPGGLPIAPPPAGMPIVNGQTGFVTGVAGTPPVTINGTPPVTIAGTPPVTISGAPKVTAQGPGGVDLARDGTPLPIKGVTVVSGGLSILTNGGNTIDLPSNVANNIKNTTTNTGLVANTAKGNKLYVSTSGGGGGGGNGGSTCFPFETPISTPSGDKAIGEIRVGDLVWAVDEETLERVTSEVTALIPHPQGTERRIVLYLSGGKSFEVTVSHPFYDVSMERFHPIGEFEAGDVVLDWSGVRSVERTIVAIGDLGSEPKDVYNFEVAAYHNYLADGILVHNIAKATGGVGLTGGMTDLTIGEAGTEAVAILRNPRRYSGGMGGPPSGPITIELHLSGNEIARFVTNWQDLFARRSTTLRSPS